jgi:hypothetical protein
MTSKNNTGKKNSGDYNSGSCNSGYYNSGYYNSGNYNSGNYNSGNRNSGDYNSGNHNSGNRNSGYYNSGSYNSGFFNTTTPKVRLFNKDSDIDRKDLNIPYIDLKINEWISEDNMTDIQKKNDPQFFVKKGTLITRTYKEAFSLAWDELSKENKQQFLDLPNFDADIFLEITGVDVRSKLTPPTCSGKVVEIDGKKYKLTEVME